MEHTAKLKRWQHELLFWGHFGLWVFAVVSPWIFPLRVLLIGFVLYALHLLVFRGCVVTIYQRYYGQVRAGEEYYQALIERVFGYHLSDQATFILSRSVEVYVIVAAILLNR